MNNYDLEAGIVDHEHIVSHGFEIIPTQINDLEFPKYYRESDGLIIVCDYLSWSIHDKYGNVYVEDVWWNTNEEFDQTMKVLTGDFAL